AHRGLTLSATCILRSYAPLLRRCQESRLPFNVKVSCGGVKRAQRPRPLVSASAHHAQGWQTACARITRKYSLAAPGSRPGSRRSSSSPSVHIIPPCSHTARPISGAQAAGRDACIIRVRADHEERHTLMATRLGEDRRIHDASSSTALPLVASEEDRRRGRYITALSCYNIIPPHLPMPLTATWAVRCLRRLHVF